MIKRDLAAELIEYSKFPAVAILGPRQAGKTTLARQYFAKHLYVSFEDEQNRSYATDDPKSFLRSVENKHGVIFDEFQYVPKLLSYLQLEIDEKKRPGYFVLTGSQNFLMNEKITQSLAGRVGIVHLYPFSLHELAPHVSFDSPDTFLFNGFYPRIYDENLHAQKFYSSYMQSYVERDVRQLVNIDDFALFQKFMSLCAGRVGQLLHIEALANDCGISAKTVKRWLAILEASYVIFMLQPYFKNFNRRITKTAKLYFFDVGLASYLLRIPDVSALATYPLRGNLFENMIIADLYKQFCNQGQRPPLYFWRDQNGTFEVDCLIDRASTLIPIEIKSGATISGDYFKGLNQWHAMVQTDSASGYVVYGGDSAQVRSLGTILPWQSSLDLVRKIDEKR